MSRYKCFRDQDNDPFSVIQNSQSYYQADNDYASLDACGCNTYPNVPQYPVNPQCPVSPQCPAGPQGPLGQEGLWGRKVYRGQEGLPVCKALQGSPARLARRGR